MTRWLAFWYGWTLGIMIEIIFINPSSTRHALGWASRFRHFLLWFLERASPRMTCLRVLSDLHLEFGPLDLEPAGEDVLVAAGDICLNWEGAECLCHYATVTGIPVVMVAGNHEFYQRAAPYTMRQVLDRLRDLANAQPLFHFLEDDIAEVAGVLFVGCTLWTDFTLNGSPSAAMALAAARMNDYRLIHLSGHQLLTPQQTAELHEFSVGVLRERLPRSYEDGRPLVVVTHHLPSARSIAGRYADDALNAAYASRLDDLVAESGAALWVHGHTHVSQDYMIGKTRVVCNPRGYYPDDLNPAFNPSLVIDV